MKRTILIAAGLGLVLGTAAPVGAEQGSKMLQGQVTEKAGNTLTVRKQDGDEVRIRATNDTEISGQTGQLEVADIETGDRVSVTTLAGTQSGEHVASEIRVQSRADMGTGTPGADPGELRPDPRQGMNPGDAGAIRPGTPPPVGAPPGSPR